MPKAGTTYLGFRLEEELGRGSFARVFLASQKALANRKVALKITLRPTREAERLARLQHTNIVPVYSVHDDAPVQAICMPFLGRRTLADLLQSHRESSAGAGNSTRKSPQTRRPSTINMGPQASNGPDSHILRVPPGGLALLEPVVGNTSAVLRLFAQLAAGLEHAHSRGILHLDLKPANVLLADTGEPMLLDFNLSADATEQLPEIVGGTIPYMAPEQLRALRSSSRGGVDARSDLYSLGVMVYELLTGAHPFAGPTRVNDFNGQIALRLKGPPPLRAAKRDVPRAVEAIVGKLLAPEPADRYPAAGALLEDLNRQMSDLPLRFARDRAIGERVGKWRRRNPRALLMVALAGMLALVTGSVVIAYHHASSLAANEAEARLCRVHEGVAKVRADLIIPDDAASREHGAQKATEILGEFDLPDQPNWRKGRAFRQISPEQQRAVAADLGELLVLLAHTKWGTAHKQEAHARKAAAVDALRLNTLAEGCFEGGSAPPFLFEQRAELAVAAQVAVTPAPTAQLKSTRDHFLAGFGHLAAGRFERAATALDRVTIEETNHGAAHLGLAYSRQQLGRLDQALERYDVARTFLPTDHRPHYFRGGIFCLQNRHDLADIEFTRAVKINPAHTKSLINRAISRSMIGKQWEAEQDLTEVIDRKVFLVRAYLQRATVRDALHDTTGAAADRRAADAATPDGEEDYVARGVARAALEPRAALEDFRAAERLNPRSLPALMNQLSVLTDNLQDDERALSVATRALREFPDYVPARAQRALLFAKLGRRGEAHQDAEIVGKSTRNARVTYQLVRVYALTSRSQQADQTRAIALLQQAIREGLVDVNQLTTDPSLESLRQNPEFQKIVIAINTLYF